MPHSKSISLLLILGLLMLSCAAPLTGGQPLQSVTPPDAEEAPQPPPPAADTPTLQPSLEPGAAAATDIPPAPPPADTPCAPSFTANTQANVRSGPGTVYDVIGTLPQGASQPVAGRNAEGDWWYIEFQNGYGWVSAMTGQVAYIPETLTVP